MTVWLIAGILRCIEWKVKRNWTRWTPPVALCAPWLGGGVPAVTPLLKYCWGNCAADPGCETKGNLTQLVWRRRCNGFVGEGQAAYSSLLRRIVEAWLSALTLNTWLIFQIIKWSHEVFQTLGVSFISQVDFFYAYRLNNQVQCSSLKYILWVPESLQINGVVLLYFTLLICNEGFIMFSAGILTAS